MELYKEYQALLAKYTEAPTEQEKRRIAEEIDNFVNLHPGELPDILLDTLKALRPRVATLRIREQIEPVMPALNMAFIAENYFHKTRPWLSQRLNGAVVNGEPASFKPGEIGILANALRDIAQKLNDVADKLHN